MRVTFGIGMVILLLQLNCVDLAVMFTDAPFREEETKDHPHPMDRSDAIVQPAIDIPTRNAGTAPNFQSRRAEMGPAMAIGFVGCGNITSCRMQGHSAVATSAWANWF
jgi:hypothetical protein